MSRENSRWTYTQGSRPEGVVVYDDDAKLHSHHDTDPARGQSSAFDLVRLHKFGHLDESSAAAAVTDRPSYRAMVEFAQSLPEIRAGRSAAEFEDLGALPESDAGVPASAVGGVLDDAANKPGRFTVYSAGEFSSGPPLEWLVRKLLPRAELAVIFGESGSGKSFLALDICAAITRGIEWRTNRVVRGGVVYVCAEGARGFKARLRAYAHEHKVELAQLPAVIADAPNLLEPKDAAALAHSIVTWIKKRGQVDVVVLDTLSATTPGGNENSAESMGLALSHCKFVHRETGALIVLIAHSGKAQERGIRGWSGVWAAADAIFEVTRNGDYRCLTVRKLKDAEEGAAFPFKLRRIVLGHDAEGDEESSCVVEHTDELPTKEGSGKKRPTGRQQVVMLEMLKTMAPSGTVAFEDLVKGYESKMPKGEGRDNRKRDAKRAVEELVKNRWAYMHGDDRVSLTSLVTTGDDGWLS